MNYFNGCCYRELATCRFSVSFLAITIHRCIHSRLLWRRKSWARLFNNILEEPKCGQRKETLSYDRISHLSSWNLFTFHIYHTWLRQIKTIWIYYIFSRINPVHFQSDSIVRYYSSNLPRFVHNFHFSFFFAKMIKKQRCEKYSFIRCIQKQLDPLFTAQ